MPIEAWDPHSLSTRAAGSAHIPSVTKGAVNWTAVSAIADIAWPNSPAASSPRPGCFWTAPWSHFPLNKESSPSPCHLLLPQQKEAPFSSSLGSRPPSLPGTTLVLLMCTLQTLSGHLSISPVRTDSHPQDARLVL